MTRIQIKRKLLLVLKEMGFSAKAITEKASFQGDLGMDSLDFAELIMLFEVHFKLEIPLLEAEQIKTINEAIDLIQSKSNLTQ